jgi:hypothetical protein
MNAVFAHRFVVESGDSEFQADVGPEMVGLVGLQEGDKVKLKGKWKISDLKVAEIRKGAGNLIRIEHKRKHGHGAPHDYQDPGDEIVAAAREGFEVTGVPRRRPKRFEILGRSLKGDFREFHVEFDGMIRKRKPPDLQRETHRSKQITRARRAKMSGKSTAGSNLHLSRLRRHSGGDRGSPG